MTMSNLKCFERIVFLRASKVTRGQGGGPNIEGRYTVYRSFADMGPIPFGTFVPF